MLLYITVFKYTLFNIYVIIHIYSLFYIYNIYKIITYNLYFCKRRGETQQGKG